MDRLKIEKAVRQILEAIGEDPKRKDLLETPRRFAQMCEEIFSGIKQACPGSRYPGAPASGSGKINYADCRNPDE